MEEHKVKIKTNLKISELDFGIKMDEVNKAFNEWRYVYENPSIKNLDTNFLGNLADELIKILEEIILSTSQQKS